MKDKTELEKSRFLYTTRREETLYFVDGRKPETHYGVGKDIHYGKIPDNCKADICNLASRHTGYLPQFFYTIKDRSGDDTVYCRGKKIGLLRDTDKLTVKFFYEETPDIYSIKEMEEMLPKAEFLQYLKDRMDEVCA